MAVPANTVQTYASVGIREDLSDMIYNISPTETPFFSAASKVDVDATYTEWQTDALTTPDTANAVVEGDDATIDAVVPTVRAGNYTQISDKTASISGTQEAVRKAGRAKEMAYQIAKKTKELKRDLEAILVGTNQARAAGNASTARRAGTLLSWIATNDDFGAGGASPVTPGATTRTDGTQRAFTETLLKSVLQGTFNSGGNPTLLMLGAANKQVASTFTGGATKFVNTNTEKLSAAVDVYKGDFGTLKIIANRFQRNRDAFVLDMDYWAIGYLRKTATWPLAKTGDTEKNQILCEWTLISKQEAASGLIADLT